MDESPRAITLLSSSRLARRRFDPRIPPHQRRVRFRVLDAFPRVWPFLAVALFLAGFVVARFVVARFLVTGFAVARFAVVALALARFVAVRLALARFGVVGFPVVRFAAAERVVSVCFFSGAGVGAASGAASCTGAGFWNIAPGSYRRRTRLSASICLLRICAMSSP